MKGYSLRCVHCNFDLNDMTLGEGHDINPVVIDTIHRNLRCPKMLYLGYEFWLFAHCHFDLMNKSLTHSLVVINSWVRNPILTMEKLWTAHKFWLQAWSHGPYTEVGYVRTVTLIWEKWSWVGQDKPLGCGQQLCKTLSRSQIAV